MPEVKFRVDSDLEAYFAKIKSQGKDLADSFVQNAKQETDSAKEQLDLINAQISALERKNRLEREMKKLGAKDDYDKAVEEIQGKRAELLKDLGAYSRKNANSGLTDKEKEDRNQKNAALGATYDDEDNLKNQYKDYQKTLKEEADEEKLQTTLAKEQIAATKDSANDYLKALKRGEDSTKLLLTAKTPTEKLALELAQERFKKEQEKEKSGGSDLSRLLTGGLIIGAASKLLSGVGNLTQSQNGFDLIRPKEELMGTAIGSVAGGVMGAIIGGLITGGAGAFTGAQLGMAGGGALGSQVGGITGGLEQRIVLAQLQYLDTQNKFRATTGGDEASTGVGDNSMYGLSKQQYLESTREMSRLSGSASNAKKNALDAYLANKGYGVDAGTSNSLVELQRYSKEGNKDLANLLGGIIAKGQDGAFKIDRSFLNEYLGRFTSLTKELLRSSNSVASGTTVDILNKFNRIGGQFATTDPRSAQLISTIQNSLASGGNSEYAKAGNFIAMRQDHPEMELVDLLIEEQKGLGSDKYLGSVLKQIKGAGGGRSQQIMNIANRLGLSNNFAAAESIYKNQDDLINNKISLKDIGISTDLTGKAKEFTTPLQENAANIADKMIEGFGESLETMVKSFDNALMAMAHGFKLQKDANGNYYIEYNAAAVRTAKAQREAASKRVTSKTGADLGTSQGRNEARNMNDFSSKSN